MPGPPSDYEEDAARIDREYVPVDATTQEEVDAALDAAGFPDASQKHISDWLVSEADAWEAVGPQTQDARSVQVSLDADSGGTVSPGRSEEIAQSVADEITSARGEAAQRVTDNGQTMTESGDFGPSIQNAEEVVRDDGIYYRATEGASNPGKLYKAASFDK